ncbi:hypothetical protein E3O23_00100, partial [Cryobacterium tagatosivorans]
MPRDEGEVGLEWLNSQLDADDAADTGEVAGPVAGPASADDSDADDDDDGVDDPDPDRSGADRSGADRPGADQTGAGVSGREPLGQALSAPKSARAAVDAADGEPALPAGVPTAAGTPEPARAPEPVRAPEPAGRPAPAGTPEQQPHLPEPAPRGIRSQSDLEPAPWWTTPVQSPLVPTADEAAATALPARASAPP